MDIKQRLSKRIDGVTPDCSKCPMSKEDCLEVMEIVKEGEGSYSTRGYDCLLKVILRDTLGFFHL